MAMELERNALEQLFAQGRATIVGHQDRLLTDRAMASLLQSLSET